MSIEWIDFNNSSELNDMINVEEVDSHEEISESVNESVSDKKDSGEEKKYRELPICVKIEPEDAPEDAPSLTRLVPTNLHRMTCPDCRKSFNPSYFQRHRLTGCKGKRVNGKYVKCQHCSKKLLSVNVSRHFSSCTALKPKGHRETISAKPKFSVRKVIDISPPTNDSVNDMDDDDLKNEEACPECLKVFSDKQGRDEHLVHVHHYHFRIRFDNRDAFMKWFKGMRFDQIMYKANMSTVNGTTYEYYFCLYTAVNRRVRIRDRCPCRAFVKENATGITVSYLDVHSHPQLKYRRFMTEECRNLILRMLERGCKNKEILTAVRDRYSESSINYTIARTTINSIRFKYKQKVWAANHDDIEELKRSLKQEVERERDPMSITTSRIQLPSWFKSIGNQPGDDSVLDVMKSDNVPIKKVNLCKDQGNQTDDTSNLTTDALAESAAVSTRENKTQVMNNIIHSILPSLEAAVRNPKLNANQLHTARVHLSKVIHDLKSSYQLETDHDYTYLS